jgi:16S rRNA processing protein RimM
MSRIAVGRLTGVFGVHGELKCRATDAQAIAVGNTFALIGNGMERSVHCIGSRMAHGRLLLRFDGIDTPEAARPLVGVDLWAQRDDAPLGPGEYRDADLVGLRLVDEHGRERARVVRVEHYPAQDCLVVEPGRALVPLVKPFIKNIDIASGCIVTALPDGLLEN